MTCSKACNAGLFHARYKRALLRAANTTQQTEGLRLRRGAKPQAVLAYDKAKQRRINGCVSGS